MKVTKTGPSTREFTNGTTTVLVSYDTPVAVSNPEGVTVTTKKYSVTTSKHIKNFCAGLVIVAQRPPEFFEAELARIKG